MSPKRAGTTKIRGLNDYGFRVAKMSRSDKASKTPKPANTVKTRRKTTGVRERTKSLTAGAVQDASISDGASAHKVAKASSSTKQKTLSKVTESSARSRPVRMSTQPGLNRASKAEGPTQQRAILARAESSGTARTSEGSIRSFFSRQKDHGSTATLASEMPTNTSMRGGLLPRSTYLLPVRNHSPLRSDMLSQHVDNRPADLEPVEALLRPYSRPTIVGNLMLRTPQTNEETEVAPVLSVSSFPPKLVASASDCDEYVITTTCQVPRGSTFDPQVSFTISSQVPASGLGTGLSPPPRTLSFANDRNSNDESDSDDEPLINRVLARATAARHVSRASTGVGARQHMHGSHVSSVSDAEEIPTLHAPVNRICPTATTAACLEHLRAVASEERKLARRHMPRALTPAHRRARFFRQVTSGRLETQRRSLFRKTPSRTRSTPQDPPTVRRKKMWERVETNFKDYQQRRYLFPRRQIFEQPIRENITLARLEKFWRILSDLIAHNKIFSRKLWDHWEYLGVVARLINERTSPEDKFGMAECDSAAKELMRQRLIMYAGDGKVMLTQNALSTRLS